ncbi:MAG: hypothetical protein K8R69_09685 [Deltaproteobacteria bacterium]|nr:hypothetical protein [Deltaproteobacteria bacterium]
MVTMTQRIQEVKKLLNLVPNQNRFLDAHTPFSQAERLMQEIEAGMLSNPFIQDEDVEGLVGFIRGPLWAMARRHIEALRHAA